MSSPSFAVAFQRAVWFLTLWCHSSRARDQGLSSLIEILPSHSIVQSLKHVKASDSQEHAWLDAYDSEPASWSGLKAMFLRHGHSNNKMRIRSGISQHNKTVNNYKVCMVMVDSRPVELVYNRTTGTEADLPYYEAAVYMNLLYAQRWKYDLLHLQVPQENFSRHASWLSLAAVKALTLLHEYHFIMFLDSDAYFVDHTVSIQKIVEEFRLAEERSAWFPTNFPFSEIDLCAGVFLVRVNQHTDNLLDYWWTQPLNDASLAWTLTQRLWEQSVLNTGNQSVRLKFEDQIAVGQGSMYSCPNATIVQHVYSTLQEHERNAHVTKALHAILADQRAQQSLESLLSRNWNVFW